MGVLPDAAKYMKLLKIDNNIALKSGLRSQYLSLLMLLQLNPLITFSAISYLHCS